MSDEPAADGPRPSVRKVLAIDGGGIRGIIPAIVLAEVERRSGKPSAELFDLIAGTSTGGIIALGVAAPGADGHPALSAEEAVSLYEELGPKIFAHSALTSLRSLGSVLHEKYSAEGLEQVLEDTFGDLRLSESVTDVLVTAYEVTRRETFMFGSRLARANPRFDFPMRVAVRATTAAPTFFEPAFVSDAEGHDHVFIDGGVFANSPAMCAFAETASSHPGEQMLMVSLGTGSLTRTLQFDQIRDWGAAQWARPILSVVLDGVSDGIDLQLRELLGPERYYRFQAPLHAGNDDMDDVRPQNMRALRETAAKLIADASARIDAVCELLVG